MRPFDADDYRKRVLAPVHARGGVEHTDPFEIYDIPLEEAGSLDDAAVADRISTVWAFWQRSRDHPRYRGLILSLLARHQELAGTLAGRAERVALAARVAAARQARDSERFAAFEAAVARIVERFGGLPADKLPGLRRIAADAGMDDAEFERRIARHRSLPAGASERTGRRPVPPEVFRQVRADLDELGKIIGDGAPRSLFELLGLAPGVSRDLIRRERDALAARNRERRPDRRRALIDDLLAAVTTLLVDGDPEAYLDALAAAATERLRPRMEAAILVEDRLTPADAAELVTAAEYEGLDRARAVAVVRALARELGADDSVVPGPGAGSTSGPGPARAAGPRTPVVDRPVGAGRPAPAPRPVVDHPPVGGASRPVRQDWRPALEAARAALAAGAPIAASDRLSLAAELAGSVDVPPIRELGRQIEAAIQQAGQRWSRLVAAIEADRYLLARQLAGELATSGRDVPGPEGRDLATVTATIEERCRAAADLLASARNAPPAERAGLALAVLDLVADYEEAQALLAASVTPPGPVTVARGAGAVEVSWVPSPTPGVRYRVLRIGPDGTTRAVGVTGETRIDDGGVPSSAELPSYEVRAGVGNFWSQPAVWPQPQPAPQPRPEPAPAGATGAVVGGGPGPAAAPVAAGSAGASAAPADADGEATRVLARTAADALDPAADLVVAGGLLRWRWPEGCTEVMVVWRPDAPPVAADDRAAESRKVTNVRYELDGGFRLPATRPLHVAVFTCVRDAAGRLVVATLAPPSARRHLSAREHL